MTLTDISCKSSSTWRKWYACAIFLSILGNNMIHMTDLEKLHE